ncbi:MAG: class I SAM-dependent methyltransferase, partial [Planctomycetes bacterium]|nr:class I SAM-dependent methyltransferase [Planctomycetota bacterium]
MTTSPRTAPPLPAPPVPLEDHARAAILADFEQGDSAAPGRVIVCGAAGEPTSLREAIDSALAPDGLVLVGVAGKPSDEELSEVRNRLWPLLHVVALYELSAEGTHRRTNARRELVDPDACAPCTLLAARRRTHVMSPDATVEKFDQNAAGWNGEAGSAGYPHFRWMRKHVALFADVPPGKRILDFGCGAGWVGIEAALRFEARELAFFDPSPEMVRIAEDNCRTAGIAHFTGRTGFGEAPPFADDEPFDLVLSSGVISFSPDPERWFSGLLACLAPGGQLVIGDIHRDSRGMRRRRRVKPLLPVRELNAWTRDEVRRELERRGLVHRA